jgi:hypothetical protein
MPPRRNPATGPNALEIGEGSVNLELVDIPIDEATLLGSQLMDAIGQLVLAVDCDKVARQPAKGAVCSLKDFYSHHSESFYVRADHIHAKNWLNNVDESLDTLVCTNEQKESYVAYKLTGEAKHWRQDKKVVLVADFGSETAISWEVFKYKCCLLGIFPSCAGGEGMRFLDLVQGGMSVIEYAAKFQ